MSERKLTTGRQLLFYFIVIAVTAADQTAKLLVRSHIGLGETVPLTDFWLTVTLTHYENSGAARSSFQGYGRYFGAFAVAFVVWVLYARRKGIIEGRWMDAGMAFFVGGAVGNAIDRLLFGQVTDFLVFHSGRGVLNLADLAINAGMLFVLAELVVGLVYTPRFWGKLKGK